MPTAIPALKYKVYACWAQQGFTAYANLQQQAKNGQTLCKIEEKAISVWGSQTEYKYKHTHATLNVHHAGTHILTLCSRDVCRSIHKNGACPQTAFRKNRLST